MPHLRFLALAGILLGLTSCAQSDGPTAVKGGTTLDGPPYFQATLDGAPWPADTVGAVVLTPTAGGVATLISATRRVSSHELQRITLGLATFPAEGHFALGGIFSQHVGFFDIDTTSAQISYFSVDARPGMVTVDAVSTTDSVLVGTFAFEAAPMPDTSAHRMLTGQFRVRYTHPAL
ncbi:MAG TPA: hypothetical protein VLV16_15090 [Gemmatimonadales bacterium]|nr:hypothetical protein [Gemmatimonadales bacterium]